MKLFCLPRELKCVFPPTLLGTVCYNFVEPNNNLREYWPHTDFWMPTFLNQPTYNHQKLKNVY